MSASPLNPDDYAYGDPDKYRAHIAELMAMVAMFSVTCWVSAGEARRSVHSIVTVPGIWFWTRA